VTPTQRLAVTLAGVGSLVGLSLVQLEPTRPVSLMDPVGSADPSGTALSWLGFGVTPVVAVVGVMVAAR
jgi:hypothetical protein